MKYPHTLGVRNAESYRIDDEPVPYGTPVDYRYLLSVLTKVRDDERDRLDRIESKIAVLLAGAFAALGFSLEKGGTFLGTFAAALYIVPIGMLLWAFAPIKYVDAPRPKAFNDSFPWYPRMAPQKACSAIVEALEVNHPRIEAKAQNVRKSIVALMIVTIIVVAVRFLSLGIETRQNAESTTASPSSAASSTAAATAATPDNGKHVVEGRKGRTRPAVTRPQVVPDDTVL